MKYKKIILPLILIIVFIIICIVSYGKSGSFIFDSFREAVVPESLLKGKILYKDILCLFPPLGYYFNALLFKIFGSKLIVLYISSVISTAIILSCVYKIMKEISGNLSAFTSVLTIMLIFVFRIQEPNSANWFFTYSYSFLYALTFCFLTFTSLILYIKYKENRLLLLSCIFLGISVAFKYDYLAFSLILLFLLIKTKSFKTIINGIILFFTPTILTFGAFILLTGSDSLTSLRNEITFLSGFASNELVIQYNKSFLPQSINTEILNNIKSSFLGFIKYSTVIFFIISILSFIYKLIKNKKLLIIIFSGILIYSVVEIYRSVDKLTLYYFFHLNSFTYLHSNFVFLPYLILLFGVLIFIYKKAKRNYFSFKEKIFYILIPIAYAIAFRDYAAIYISNIGNFTALPFWMIFIYLFIEIIPNIFTKLNNKKYKIIFCLTLIIYSLTYTYQYVYAANLMKYKIEYPKGCYFVSDVFYPIINKSITHAEDNIKGQNKSLLYLEEGMYVHYFLDIPFIDMHLYALNPHNIPVLGEEYIIDKIAKNKTSYIYNFEWSNHGVHGDFGKDYAKEIYKYILDNYELESITESNEEQNKSKLYIYKRKI